MNLALVAILAGLGPAVLVAARLGGVLGVGVMGGYLFGASLGLLGASWQRHVLATRPEQIFNATVTTFLFKLAGVLAGALALRYLDALARVADWRGFVVSFGVAALLCIVCASFDNSRALKRRSAH